MTIVAGTDAYVSINEADTYWAERNNSTWEAASDEDKEKALREATAYIDGTFEGRWIGEHPGSSSQVLAWPRNNARDSEGRDVTGIPQRVKDATARLALDGLSAFLTGAEDRGGGIKRAKVGPLDVTYFDNAPAGKTFPYLDIMLKGLLVPGGNKLRRV